ncbi:protein SRC2-like [Cornus florida]|uniref:protein SRC2-like n=1 Tax=Cornus florida TaxID=4283 RepID=UPI00289FF576|nr:protein SRC2-like [Cornus florida]
MAYRTLDITIISAEGLDDVNLVTKMDVYVVASISSVRKLTPADKHGGTKPKPPRRQHHLRLKFSYKYDGKFTPPHTAAPAKGQEPVTVHPPNIGVSTTVAQPAGVAMAYPRPPYTYPLQQAGRARGGGGGGGGGVRYPPPPQAYPVPAMAGYGYPQPQVEKPKKKKDKFGTGFGAGLIGGLIVGDMVSDIGDAGYEDGFDDVAFDM